MPAISVIMPAYNSEKFIGESLESLVSQTFRDFEVIAVDDGSEDSTGKIIAHYSAEYPFIKSLKKANGGVSSARNAGLEAAKGKYIAFLDSDDTFSPETLGELYKTAEENRAELVIGKIRNFSDLGADDYQPRAFSLSKKGDIEPFDSEILWNFLLGNKLFLRSVIEQNSLRFPALDYSEDGVFLMNFVLHAERIHGCEGACLNYRRTLFGSDSLSRSINEKSLADFIAAHERIYASLLECSRLGGEEKQLLVEELAFKTCFALMGQFYRRFWFASEDCIALIASQVKKWYGMAGEKHMERLSFLNNDFDLENLPRSFAEMRENTKISVIVYDNNASKEKNARFFASLFNQNLPAVQVIVPRSMLENGNLPEQWHDMGNLTALHGDGYSSLARERAEGKYIVTFKKPIVMREGILRATYRSGKAKIFGGRLFSVAVHTLIKLQNHI